MSFTIQQALTPTVDALVEAAKEKFRSEFESEAEHSAFAPGKQDIKESEVSCLPCNVKTRVRVLDLTLSREHTFYLQRSCLGGSRDPTVF